MARSVEGQVARYSADVDSCKTGLSSLFELIEGRVGSVHIGKVMFVVVESHYLLRNRRFERVVLVGQIWQRVSFTWHESWHVGTLHIKLGSIFCQTLLTVLGRGSLKVDLLDLRVTGGFGAVLVGNGANAWG